MNSKPGQILVKDLIDKYERGEIGIPEFQRDYVWGNDRMLALLDSIYKNYPIGALIVWSPPLNTKVQAKKAIIGRPVQWLIDGQQRTYSLVLSIEEQNNICFNPLVPEFKLLKIIKDKRFIPINSIFDDIEYPVSREDYKKIYGNNPDIEKNLEKCRRIRDFPLAIIEMDGHEYQETIEAFKRVNTQGVRLKSDDIQSASISFKHTSFIQTKVQPTLQKLRESGYDRINTGQLFIACNYILRKNKKDKRTIFDDGISTRELEDVWRRLEKSLKWMMDMFDTEFGLKNMSMIPSGAALIPIVVAHSKTNIQELSVKKILKWYLISVINKRYDKSTNSVLAKDLDACLEEKPLLALYKVAGITKNSRAKMSSLDALYSDKTARMILYIATISIGGVDLFTGQKIKGCKNLDRHHIYPQAKFSKDDEDIKILVNSIANISFITRPVNNNLKDSLPETYLESIKQERRESIFINGKTTLWTHENFKIRIQMRKKAILKSFNEYLGKI